ncbi:vacuolar protein sorting-associated protein 36 isoform X2 [Olea europaea var. sylvestris]|uniref:vacuolar protein sorting-associated protein 36 isoform X2 n=1 Tax=Olea europaea var. sylvestris TaxID=158386 RepID=UPI000C1CF3C5|nr:vacuolar protein sorting-associated protein 36 isoform X2 [Olea europaea var. sylvestris]
MAGNFLPAAKLTASGRPVLDSGEVECSLLSTVDLHSEDLSAFPLLKSGLLILTTHRLLWLSSDSNTPTAVYIPLSTIQHIFSTKKSIKSMFHSPRIRFQVSTTPEGHVSEKGLKSLVITLILRGKTDIDSFLGKFWDAWRGRAWETSGSATESGLGSGSGEGSESLALKVPVVGVSGILRKEQEMWESTDKSLQDAFQDLNALMSKAKEMVVLAERMRLKLLSGSNNQTGETNDDDMGTKEEMQDWLLSVGIASPVTKESAGALYHQQLSRQLADFVKKPLERAGGMINLIDIYCLFNRARGTELISPDDLRQACSLWEKFDTPVMLRKFDSGVMVIQNKTHSDDEVFSRIRSLVLKPDATRTGISASDAAMTLGVAPAMAKEYLLAAEGKGFLCRDVSSDGFRFYINLFPEISPDDRYFVKDHGIYSMWISAVSFR